MTVRLFPARLAQSLRALRDRLTFDARYYQLVHEDVAEAVAADRTRAYAHFKRHGRGEGRRHRFSAAARLPGSDRYAVLRKPEPHLSGVTIRVAKAHAGETLTLSVYRIKHLRPSLAHSIAIDGPSCLDDGATTVPLPRAEGTERQTLVMMLRRQRDRRRVSFAIDTDAFITSSPSLSEGQARGPGAIVLSPVTQCNLNCTHCISRSTRSVRSELSEKAWGEIERLAKAGQLQHVASDYSGDIFYLADQKRSRWLDRILGLGVSVEFDTHANNLTPDVCERLLASRVTTINFSLDSMDEAVHRSIRKGSIGLPGVLANIAAFLELRNARRPDIKVCISFVLMRSNIATLEPAIAFAARYKIDWVQGSHLSVFTPDMVEESLMLAPDLYAQHFARLSALAAADGVHLAFPRPVRLRGERPGHHACRMPWEAALVLGNGDVMACCMPGTRIGNLDADSFAAIWHSPAATEFRTRVNTADPPDVCARCNFYRYENAYESYVPGLSPSERRRFVERVLAQPHGEHEVRCSVSLSDVELSFFGRDERSASAKATLIRTTARTEVA